MRMRHLQAAHLFPFSGGRRPDERDSCKLKFLDLFFCGGRLPSENVTAASWIFLIFLRWQAPSWTFLTFLLRWQAPKRKCDSCKLDICLTFLRWQAPRWAWQLKTKPSLPFFAVAGSQVKMWQLQAGYSWRFCGGRLPDENATLASYTFCGFLRWQVPRWVRQLKAEPS